ncbi:MAG: hypothetical protein PHS49_01845 [Candidatus Gracilibacteria bacterium]|nr:hypothetical protein [Candidatus Gracilibacteria bacterium]
MINKKILAVVLLASVTAAGIGVTFADDSSTGSTGTGVTNNGFFKNFKDFGGFKHRKEGFKNNLTDDEKTEFASMSDVEKKSFFDKKREEQIVLMEKNKVDRELREGVIDALLAGKSLTSEQEILRNEIIKERAERKTKMLEKEEEMTKFRAIMDKKKTGETLTSEEQTILDNSRHTKKDKSFGKWR